MVAPFRRCLPQFVFGLGEQGFDDDPLGRRKMVR